MEATERTATDFEDYSPYQYEDWTELFGLPTWECEKCCGDGCWHCDYIGEIACK